MLKKLFLLLVLVVMFVLVKFVFIVYIYDFFFVDWGFGLVVKKVFEVECGCELKFVVLEDGVLLLNCLCMEGKNSKVDVVFGFDNNLLEVVV